jgi:hypothetical protein
MVVFKSTQGVELKIYLMSQETRREVAESSQLGFSYQLGNLKDKFLAFLILMSYKLENIYTVKDC